MAEFWEPGRRKLFNQKTPERPLPARGGLGGVGVCSGRRVPRRPSALTGLFQMCSGAPGLSSHQFSQQGVTP